MVWLCLDAIGASLGSPHGPRDFRTTVAPTAGPRAAAARTPCTVAASARADSAGRLWPNAMSASRHRQPAGGSALMTPSGAMPTRPVSSRLTPLRQRATIAAVRIDLADPETDMSFLQSRTRLAREGFGKPILRQEDARLLTGGGCYSDDVNVPGQAYACFVRSPHAHARVERIETGGALATPGVIAVLTGADALADGVKPLTHSPMPRNPNEDMLRPRDVAFIAPHPPIPADRVRFVGEIVAMVVAETQAAARDGAERVDVRWTALPAVPLSTTAARPDAPLLYDGTRSNVCVDTDLGDAAAVDRAFADAVHV